jgi:hypothetical protein
MHVPGRIAPGLTLGAALSNNTRDLPLASLPVTTRRIGFGLSAIGFRDLCANKRTEIPKS